MKEIVRHYNNKIVRIAGFDDKMLIALHDCAWALEFEDPRAEAMHLVINENERSKGELAPFGNHVVFVAQIELIIKLAMQHRDMDKAINFLAWLSQVLVEETRKIADTAPKEEATYSTSAFYATTQIAKMYGLSASGLNQILHDQKVQFKVNKQWVLYSEYQDKGYVKTLRYDKDTENGDRLIMHSYWTPKGVKFIEDLLDRLGYKKAEQQSLFDQRV